LHEPNPIELAAMKALTSFALILFASVFAYGQTTVADSLKKRLTYEIGDAERTNIYLRLSKILLEADPTEALEYAQRASQLATNLGADSLIAYSNLYQGNAFLHSGIYSRALQFYIDVIPGSIERKDSLLLAVAYANMGNVYYFQGDYENALKNDLIALNYFVIDRRDATGLLKRANLLSNIGTIYDETKKFDEAEKYYNEAHKLALALDNHEVLGNVLNNLGTMYRDKGMNDLAIKYYTDALQLRERNGNKFGMARSNYSLGLYHFNEKNFSQATSYLSKSVELATEVGSMQTVSSAAQYLYQSLKQSGDSAKALQSLELYMQVKDSLYNEQSTRKIAQLEAQFEFDKRQKEAEIAQRRRELYYSLSGALLLVLLLIAAILFLIQKNKLRKAEIKEAKLNTEQAILRNDLETKKKELTTNIMFLLSKNELINSISEELLTIRKSIPGDSQKVLQKVILDLQSNLQPELWQEFEYRFQQVHENFYQSLTARFPDLTPSERRLCAFLKLNMTTKEISSLTHQNAKSIDVARTRLRKKLGLTGTDQNLVTFLEQLVESAST
jgi:tetratricopeptide (TPR) repeat protein